MLFAGKRLSLSRQTIAVALENGKRIAIMVPAEAVIEVLPGFKERDVTVEVMWSSLQITMFAVDVEERGRAARSQKIVDPQWTRSGNIGSAR